MKRTGILAGKGFTLVEILISLGVLGLVGGIGYAMLMSSTTLLAKNLSINSTNITARGALDRIYSEMDQANRLPSLINADGSAVTTTGPAAGIVFDKYVGGPYIVGNPGTGLAASATTFKLFCSLDSLASPPVPVKNDVVIMDGSTRALVASSSTSTSLSSPVPNPTPTSGQMITVTLQKTLGNYANPPVSSGNAISWSANTQETAYVIHRRAFVVVPVTGGTAELRFYRDAETVTDYNDASQYVVLSRGIGTQTIAGLAENTPFSLVTQNGTTFVNVAMRVEDQLYNRRLASQQANEINTFLRIDTMFRPRNIP